LSRRRQLGAPRQELDARSTGRTGVSSEIDEHHEGRSLRDQLLARPTKRRSATAAPCFPHATRLSLTPPRSLEMRGTQAADDVSRELRIGL
jgi:hypothetical protein